MELKHSEDFYIRSLLNKVKLEEIMTKEVRTLDLNEPFSHVEETFRKNNIRHVPIIDSSRKLVGLVTQRDLYRISPPRKNEDGTWFYDKKILDEYILKHVMTADPAVLKPADTVAKALLLMVDRKYGCIPIVDDLFHLKGIVTQADILRIGAQILKEGENKASPKK